VELSLDAEAFDDLFTEFSLLTSQKIEQKIFFLSKFSHFLSLKRKTYCDFYPTKEKYKLKTFLPTFFPTNNY